MSTTFGLQVSGEAAVAITVSTDAIASLQAMILTNPPFGAVIPAPTTLAVAALAGDTSFTLMSAAGVAAGMGIVIGTEYSLVTGAPTGNVVPVTRARFSTTAAAHALADAVSFLQWGSYSVALAELLCRQLRQLVTVYPGSTVTAANAAIATQNAAIAAAVAAGASHAP
jgi:hypothetical protein